MLREEMIKLIITFFLFFTYSKASSDELIHCPTQNGTQTGLLLKEQNWWHKFKTYLAGVEDIPVQLVSISRFHKNKTEKEKQAVLENVKNNCMRIGGKLIEESIHDFTRGPISYGGICIRDKAVLQEKNVKYIMVRGKGRAIFNSMKEKVKVEVRRKCEEDHKGQVINQVEEVTDFLDIFYFAAVCKVKTS